MSGKFAADLRRFADKTKMEIPELRRAVTLKLISAVVMDTPVLSGRLRGEWQTTLGAPAKGQNGRVDPDGHLVLAEAEEKVTGQDGSVWFTNNMPYALRIEYDGWSHTKAPGGMVRRNVARFQRLLREEAKK